jgi:hypothetical protein
VALDPSKETKEWLVTVGALWAKKEKRHNELRAESQKRIAGAQARRAQLAKDPNWKPKQYIVE